MTPEERAIVDGARKRASDAPGGPWKNNWRARVNDTFDGHAAVISADPSVSFGGIVIGLIWYDGLNVACSEATAEFIAHARSDVPTLCDLADRQEAELLVKDARIAELEAELARMSM